MNINATLFVQAINFFIAYLLFRFIFLKPAYRVIVQEQKDKEKLEGLVEGDEKSLVEVREQRVAGWRACQKYCGKYLPGQIHEMEIFRGIAPKLSTDTLSSKERRAMTESISQSIVSHVEGIDGTH